MTCARLVDDVRPNPSCDHRMEARPNAIRERLRIACTATCGSSLQAWMQRSPPVACGTSASPGKRGRSTSAAGRRSAMPKRSTPSAVVNSDGPRPHVMVRPAGGRSSASPVSSGGESYGPSSAPSAPADPPAVMRAAAALQSSRSETRPARSMSATSNAAKCRRSWAGVVIPAWCAPWNAYVAPPAAWRAPAKARSAMTPPAEPTRPPPSAPAPRRPRIPRRETPAGASAASAAAVSSGVVVA